ncbi:sugar phosphate isomerase/epimerase family protein [Synechocystis salina]|uniref:Sugar phosphate isomerase/epimerase n=1 Tax=Synechocystis salina LEGE 00031 TaxID=1828736 RepID=A0ABR9VRD9_9SYNC|nr:sugar phosphate isomerase/epimerase family protein [Synechocystis salina]MBE9241393.1 sugar phosphate isomerase/epimerase [Synechocystis salina LEGE 00041]MBE9253058.1 sugar phosphate isomerase/epimerase [Synechocystis salina LEGE 00031]
MIAPPPIKFGVHTFIWKKEFLGQEEYIFRDAKVWQFDGVEIASHFFDQIDPGRLKDFAHQSGLELTFCTSLPQGLSLTSEDETCWRDSIAYLQRAIVFCQQCGITQLSGPFPHPVGYLSGEPLQKKEAIRMQDAFKLVAETLVKTDLKLAIEPLNRFQGYALNTVEQGLALLDAVNCDQLGLLLDLFHMNIEEKDVLQAFRRAGNKCFHIHACAKDRGTPGSDSFAWSDWFKVLQEINYQGWVTIESFNFEDQELASGARLWRPLAPTSADIARDGVKFLRQTYQNQ